MKAKLEKLLPEPDCDTYITNMGGNGMLPSHCFKCDGILDFKRVAIKDKMETVLKCRKCGNILEID